MSFKARFKAGSIEANVISCHFTLHQEIDVTGRPSSVTRGGTLHIVLESSSSTELFEWMCNSFEKKDGSIVYLKRDSEATLKELKWVEGWLVNYTETFTASTADPFNMSLIISAREISLGSGTHVNEWPDV